MKKFLKHEHGLALLEFALVFPLLFVLLFGSIEVIRLLYIQQRVEKAGYVMADIVGRYPAAKLPIAAGQINRDEMNNNVFPIFTRIMTDLKNTAASTSANQAVIVTSITKTSGVKRINWQIGSPGGGNDTDNKLTGCLDGVCVRSVVNQKDISTISPAVVNTPTNFINPPDTTFATMPDGENMIVVEVFYHYKPILQTLMQNTTSINFYLKERYYTKTTYFTPRNDPLIYLPPDFPPP